MENIEKRRQPRKHIGSLVKIEEKKGFYFTVQGYDISVTGLSFFLDNAEEIQPGQLFTMGFDLPIKGKLLSIHAIGKIVQKVQQGSHKYKIGIAFIELDTLSSWIIEAFVKSKENIVSPEFSESVWTKLHSQHNRALSSDE